MNDRDWIRSVPVKRRWRMFYWLKGCAALRKVAIWGADDEWQISADLYAYKKPFWWNVTGTARNWHLSRSTIYRITRDGLAILRHRFDKSHARTPIPSRRIE